jgi:putative hydrolase of the HAD superfamily
VIKCVTFDMDDTLYDEIDYYKSGFAAVAGQVGNDFGLKNRIVFNCLWQIFNAGNHKTTFDAAAEKLGITFDAEYIKKLVNVLRNHTPNITLPSQSREVLAELKGCYKLGLITDGYLPAQELKVKALGFEELFDCIIYTEKLGREYWKPSPAGFEKLLAELGAVANQCVYIGDNLKKDFIAPNKMGLKTVRIIRKNRIHNSPAPYDEAQAHYEIDSITKLPDLLEAINAV